MDSGDDLHQRGLAGAVLSHDRVHGPRVDPQRDVVQRNDAGKRFAVISDFEKRSHCFNVC